ncbi:MAG: glycosyltransferase family 2 protein [Terracidiphilus sp.]|jgi:glycosyltransferase involved in cell wall biosynthesis
MNARTEELPSVSMVVVCRNEARWIGRCLDSVIQNGYPADRVEILVVDGDSNDGTQEILEQYASLCARIKVLHNFGRYIPLGLNMGIRAARGEIIMKVDAHSEYPPNYISDCVYYLTHSGAANVGGGIDILPGSDTLFARAVAKVLSSRFGVGNSGFRVSTGEPVWADTAYSGCYWKSTLLKVGLYDEAVIRSEDIDMNSRLRALGGRTLLVPTIRIRYYTRPYFTQFCRYALSNGYWVTFPALANRTRFSTRHFAPLAFVTGQLALLALCRFFPPAQIALASFAALYAACALTASALAWKRCSSPLIVLVTAFTYAAYHELYGLGSIAGLIVGVGHLHQRLRPLPQEPVAEMIVPSDQTGPSAELPFVSLVLACRNEAQRIESCLSSLELNDYPVDRAEILVVDGESTDGTLDIVRRHPGTRYPVRLMTNALRLNAVGMNLGIRESLGSVIMKIDGHSVYPPNYISECVSNMRKYGAANVGGVVEAVPGADTTFARAAAKVVSCRFGVGSSLFRVGVNKPTWANTAYSGCYQKSWLLKAGLYDESLCRGADIDLNGRLWALGGRTLLVPAIRVKYYARADLAEFCRRALLDGYWVSYAALDRGTRLAIRHFVPLAFVVFIFAFALLAIACNSVRPFFLAVIAAYAICAVGASVATWRSLALLRLIITTAFTFWALHTFYGFGSLLGVAGWAVSRRPFRGLWQYNWRI